MLLRYFDYMFGHLSQKVRLRPELSPKFLSTLGLNPTRKARPDLQPGVPIFVEHWGDDLQFYPNFALFSTLEGMNLDHDFV